MNFNLKYEQLNTPQKILIKSAGKAGLIKNLEMLKLYNEIIENEQNHIIDFAKLKQFRTNKTNTQTLLELEKDIIERQIQNLMPNQNYIKNYKP